MRFPDHSVAADAQAAAYFARGHALVPQRAQPLRPVCGPFWDGHYSVNSEAAVMAVRATLIMYS